jgi:hypothetical protein
MFSQQNDLAWLSTGHCTHPESIGFAGGILRGHTLCSLWDKGHTALATEAKRLFTAKNHLFPPKWSLCWKLLFLKENLLALRKISNFHFEMKVSK